VLISEQFCSADAPKLDITFPRVNNISAARLLPGQPCMIKIKIKIKINR
jgi:hypothetical protein